MKHLLITLTLLATIAWGDDSAVQAPASHELLNPDFSGWVRYLSEPDADPDSVWTYSDGVVHCTGTPKGYLRSETVHSNYTLHVEWRWTGEPGNSGVLLHIQDPEDHIWPISIESQLKAGDAGDFYVIGGTSFKEREGAEGRRTPKQHPSNEKPAGEWNEKDIVCDGDTITITVNGVVQNRATGCTVSSGHIGLQSEGAPIEFRNVRLTPLEK